MNAPCCSVGHPENASVYLAMPVQYVAVMPAEGTTTILQSQWQIYNNNGITTTILELLGGALHMSRAEPGHYGDMLHLAPSGTVVPKPREVPRTHLVSLCQHQKPASMACIRLPNHPRKMEAQKHEDAMHTHQLRKWLQPRGLIQILIV